MARMTDQECEVEALENLPRHDGRILPVKRDVLIREWRTLWWRVEIDRRVLWRSVWAGIIAARFRRADTTLWDLLEE